jgi:hypothetical protein
MDERSGGWMQAMDQQAIERAMDSASDRSGQWKERKKLQEMNQWKE